MPTLSGCEFSCFASYSGCCTLAIVDLRVNVHGCGRLELSGNRYYSTFREFTLWLNSLRLSVTFRYFFALAQRFWFIVFLSLFFLNLRQFISSFQLTFGICNLLLKLGAEIPLLIHALSVFAHVVYHYTHCQSYNEDNNSSYYDCYQLSVFQPLFFDIIRYGFHFCAILFTFGTFSLSLIWTWFYYDWLKSS